MDNLIPVVFNLMHRTSSYTTVASSKLKHYSANPPDLQTIVLLLIILYLSVMILTMATRWLYALVMGFIRIALFLGLVALCAWVWRCGAQEVSDTVSSFLVGFEGFAKEKGREWTAQTGASGSQWPPTRGRVY